MPESKAVRSVATGELQAIFRGEKRIVRAGETVHIPANAPHQFPKRLVEAGEDALHLLVGRLRGVLQRDRNTGCKSTIFARCCFETSRTQRHLKHRGVPLVRAESQLSALLPQGAEVIGTPMERLPCRKVLQPAT